MTIDGFRYAMSQALRNATPFALDQALIDTHYFAAFDSQGNERTQPTTAETQFRQAATHGLASIPKADRSPALNPTTGHVAESIAGTLLDDFGWTIVDQQAGDMSGGHGVDLAALAPDMKKLFVVEVKGTLTSSRWPRLTHREVTQLSSDWLDKEDQPGMASLGVEAADVFGLVIALQFGLNQWKAAATADFRTAHPIRNVDQLGDTTWLTDPSDGERNVASRTVEI